MGRKRNVRFTKGIKMKIILIINFLVFINLISACNLEDDPNIEINQTNFVKEKATGCELTMHCFESCGENRSCIDRCLNTQNSEESSKALELLTCYKGAQSECFTDQCLEQKCTHFINMCTRDAAYSCGEVIDCQEGCSTTECNGRCTDLATPTAKNYIDEILVCFGECSDDPDCIDRRCTDKIATCRMN